MLVLRACMDKHPICTDALLVVRNSSERYIGRERNERCNYSYSKKMVRSLLSLFGFGVVLGVDLGGSFNSGRGLGLFEQRGEKEVG